MNNNGQAVTPTWLRQVATALSSRYNVNVKEGRGWSMDVERHTLTYKPEHLLALDRDTCLGILLHELGHLHFTSNDWTDKAKLHQNGQHPLADITFSNVNAFEDVRINEKMSQSYGGSRELIDAMNELLAGDGLQSVKRMSDELRSGRPRDKVTDQPEHFEITYISMLRLMGRVPDKFMDEYYDQHKRQLIDEIVELAHDMKHKATTQEVYDFVEREVYPRLQPYLPQNQAPQSGDGEGEKGDGNETGQEQGTTSTGSDGNSENSEGSSPDGSNSEAEKKDGENDSEADGNKQENGDASKNDTNASTKGADSEKDGQDKNQQQTSKAGDGVGIDQWKRDLERKIQQAIRRGRINPDETQRTHPFGGRNPVPRASTAHAHLDMDMHLADSKTLQQQFANKFATLFRDNQFKRETRNQRSGRIDKRSLYKFPQGKQRLFKRKLDISKKDYAVAFLQDVSGSMGWEQLQGSYHAMLAFSTTLDKLNIPYGMGFFGRRSMIAKNFADRKLDTRNASIVATSVGNSHTNPDELLKQLCEHQLAKLNVQEKIVVILTDGQWDRDSYEQLRKLKQKNPDMHIYMVALGMAHWADDLRDTLGKTATLLVADEPKDIVERYIEVARKHLL